jgi:peptidoglycan LD-endopeptidase CwlK
MNAASEKRLAKLHPTLGLLVRQIVADLATRGINIEVVQGLRTFEEQDALYAKGRTAPGQIVTQAKGGESNHNYGLAVDVCPFVDGKPHWNAPIEVWVDIGRTAERFGLEWGGSWKKFVDKPHLQLPNMTVKACQRCFATGGLPGVWAEATKRSVIGAATA